MLSRATSIPIVLGAAVAAPYFVSNSREGITSLWPSSAVQETTDTALADLPQILPQQAVDAPPRGPGSELYPVDTPLEGLRGISLEEVFRFDVTKEWVYEHWARKSTALAELGLFGVRVPLVSGTELHDVAGSLTYFFDSSGKVQRISFRGQTGDTTKLVMLAAHRLGLQRQPSVVAGEQLYQARHGDSVVSELRTSPSAVLWSSSPHNSFDVTMDLQPPGSVVPLPSKVPPPPSPKASQGVANSDSPSSELTAEQEAAQVAEKQLQKRRELDEKLRTFFPRSRVPQGQVKSLEKRDLYW